MKEFKRKVIAIYDSVSCMQTIILNYKQKLTIYIMHIQALLSLFIRVHASELI